MVVSLVADFFLAHPVYVITCSFHILLHRQNDLALGEGHGPCSPINLCMCGCKVKFVQESGFTRMWEVTRYDKLQGVIFCFLATK